MLSPSPVRVLPADDQALSALFALRDESRWNVSKALREAITASIAPSYSLASKVSSFVSRCEEGVFL